MYRILSILFVFINCVVVSYAQMTGVMTLTGKIMDEETSLPIEYATISIFSAKDSTLIGGGISELEGVFVIEGELMPSYAVIDYLSYESKVVDIPSPTKTMNLGTIFLISSSLTIEGIEVVGEKSTSQYLLDKKVFNVGSDLATKGGSLQDVLENVPSITVDIEGNVALRGSNAVRILINGKPSGLLGISGAGGLRNLQASQIERIEVITNPSARYDAEGSAGIINVVLKKDNRSGFSGSFEVNAGLPQMLGAGANLSYRKEAVNFFVNYSFNKATRPGSGRNYTEFFNGDTTLVTALDRTMDRQGFNQAINTGLDFYLPHEQTITTSFTMALEDNDNVNTINYRDLQFVNQSTNRSQVESLRDFTRRTDNELEKEQKIEYALDYNKKFKGKDHSLNANIQYQLNGEQESSQFDEAFYQEGEKGPSLLQQRSANDEREERLLGQVDYIRPLGAGKLELGHRTSIRFIGNDFEVQSFQDEEWVNEVGLSNMFDYDEAIYANYIIYGNKRGPFSYQLGLRSEYSNISTFLRNTQEGYDSTYHNFFPSVSLSYGLGLKDQVQVSYSRRINRPSFWSLNPFFTFTDNRNFFAGNPFLLPEYIDSYEIGYLKYIGDHNINTSVYYRKVTDNISRIKTVNTDGTSLTLPQNLGFRDELGVELLFGYNPFQWLKVDAETNLFYQNFYGEELPEEFRASSFVVNGRLNFKVNTKSGYDLQVRSNYRGPNDTPQGRRRPVTTIDAGISKDFLRGNMTVTLNARDILNQRRWVYERFDETFYEDGEFQWMRNSVTLSISYRINSKKERKRGGGDFEGGGGEY